MSKDEQNFSEDSVLQDEQNTQNDESVVSEEDPIKILLEENAKLKESYLRLSAETDNYRKRLQQEKENFQKFAVKGFVEKLLPVVDNLERSVQAAENSDNISSLKEGVQMVLTQFETVLQDAGLDKISLKIGDEFDPQLAEALMMEEREDVEHSMTVVDVFETGRILNGQVIRTSKVKVAKKI